MAVRADGRIMASGGWDGRWEEPKVVCIESSYTEIFVRKEGGGGGRGCDGEEVTTTAVVRER